MMNGWFILINDLKDWGIVWVNDRLGFLSLQYGCKSPTMCNRQRG